MPRSTLWRRIAGIAALLAIAATTYWTSAKSRTMNTISDDAPMHTLCVGRYLIDVPANYELEHYNYRINGVDISWYFKANDRSGFDAAVNERKAELGAERNGYEKPSLEEPEELRVGEMPVVILRYGRSPPTYTVEYGEKRYFDQEDLSAEAWVWTGTHTLRFLNKDTVPKSYRKDLMILVESLKNIEVGTTPTEDGFCMEMFDARAMIAGPPRSPDTYEGAEIQFGLKDRADVKYRLVFYPHLNEKPVEPLLERSAKSMNFMKDVAWRIQKLRHQRRTVRGMDGEELVEAFREQKGTRAHSFDWEWLGRYKDPLAPRIDLEAQTGYSRDGPVNSSLSDEAALKLWDRVLDSIRLRPVKEDAQTSQAESRAPLGSLAVTGRICEQSGLWECDEQRAADDQRHRFIREGQVMPSTVVTGEASGLWGRLRGERTVQRVATMWKLIGYGEPPPSDTAPHAQAISPPAADAPQDPPPRS